MDVIAYPCPNFSSFMLAKVAPDISRFGCALSNVDTVAMLANTQYCVRDYVEKFLVSFQYQSVAFVYGHDFATFIVSTRAKLYESLRFQHDTVGHHSSLSAHPSRMQRILIRLRNVQSLSSRVQLQWPHNGCDGVSNHKPHHRLPNRLFRRRSKKTSKLCVTGLCAGNSPVAGEFPAQRPVTRKMFPFDDVIITTSLENMNCHENISIMRLTRVDIT